MSSRSEPLLQLPENVLSVSASQRAWNGVHVEITAFRCGGPVLHHLRRETHNRLSVLLEEAGSPCEPRLHKNRPCPVGWTPRHMHFAPAGLEVWGYSADPHFVREATLSFDLDVLEERLGTEFAVAAATTPRVRFSDDRIWTPVRLLADAIDDPDPSAQLYGDGLTAAIAARLFAQPRELLHRAGGLTPWQLRRVADHLDAHLPERVELAQLAALTGLSQSHFSRAFKASTGMAPYRWQLDARIRRAQALLLGTNATLEQVAVTTGFADAVHFGRIFRKLVGATPAAWRRDRQS